MLVLDIVILYQRNATYVTLNFSNKGIINSQLNKNVLGLMDAGYSHNQHMVFNMYEHTSMNLFLIGFLNKLFWNTQTQTQIEVQMKNKV